MDTVYIVLILVFLWAFVLKPSKPKTSSSAKQKPPQQEVETPEDTQEDEKASEDSKDSEFAQLADQLKAANVRFYGANWCGACSAQKKLCKEAGVELDDIFFDVDKNREDSIKHKVEYLPHWVIVGLDGEAKSSKTGVQRLEDLLSWCKENGEEKQQTESSSEGGGKYAELSRLLKQANIRFYGASWCGACNYQKEQCAKENVSLDGIYFESDDNEADLKKYDINVFPTWVKLDKDKNKIDEKVGAQLLGTLLNWCK